MRDFNDPSTLVPPEEVLKTAGIGGGDFVAVGAQFLQYFRDLASLKKTDMVLEIGCGVGRMAVALTRWLEPPAVYEGFDTVASSIDWCQNHISRRYGHFHFQHIDVRNTFYNPTGQLSAHELRFPFDDRRFDVVIATSVFTHLQPSSTLRYLSESRRVLRPNGRLFATWFMWRDESNTSEHAAVLFPHDLGHHKVASLENPEAVIAFTEEYVFHAYESVGLRIVRDLRGNWGRGEHSLPYQDMIIASPC